MTSYRKATELLAAIQRPWELTEEGEDITTPGWFSASAVTAHVHTLCLASWKNGHRRHPCTTCGMHKKPWHAMTSFYDRSISISQNPSTWHWCLCWRHPLQIQQTNVPSQHRQVHACVGRSLLSDKLCSAKLFEINSDLGTPPILPPEYCHCSKFDT